ncbi:response regulator [Thalassospira sp.]|uniref:response regulator n=1 Tax=Thalassospira sp. TaxID=1912094 RepID=UPI002732366F|nr:response regulator [Thalassospira sp.]MDP2699156.1 response regulator [Thalassospira sp.]
MTIILTKSDRKKTIIAQSLDQIKTDLAYRLPASEKRILLVDDSIEVRFSLRRILRSAGIHQINGTNNGVAAIQMVLNMAQNDTPYHVVILDYMMPGLTGMEILDEIRQSGVPGTEKTRFIFLTGFRDQQLEDAARIAGAAFILDKPCNTTKLMAAIG